MSTPRFPEPVLSEADDFEQLQKASAVSGWKANRSIFRVPPKLLWAENSAKTCGEDLPMRCGIWGETEKRRMEAPRKLNSSFMETDLLWWFGDMMKMEENKWKDPWLEHPWLEALKALERSPMDLQELVVDAVKNHQGSVVDIMKMEVLQKVKKWKDQLVELEDLLKALTDPGDLQRSVVDIVNMEVLQKVKRWKDELVELEEKLEALKASERDPRDLQGSVVDIVKREVLQKAKKWKDELVELKEKSEALKASERDPRDLQRSMVDIVEMKVLQNVKKWKDELVELEKSEALKALKASERDPRDLERLVVYLLILDPADRDAYLANEATKSTSTLRLQVLVELACTRSSPQLLLWKQAYHARYKKSPEEDIVNRTTGDFRQLLLSLVSSYRYCGDEVDMTLAKEDAKILHEKILKKAYSDKQVIWILATRSKAQVNAILDHYRNEFGNDINKDLKIDPKDEFLFMLRATVKCLTRSEKYFEKVLRLAIKRRGTDEAALIRVVVTRAEVDMKLITEEYQRKNNVPLYRAIVEDSHGEYEKMLLALVGHADSSTREALR